MSSPKRQKKAAQHRVGFCGSTGAFSEMAAKKYFNKTNTSRSPGGPVLETVGFSDFASVFDAVAKGSVDFGLVPVENTVSGTIREVYDLLVKHDKLCITGETTEVETLCLCGNKGATKDTVKTVRSDAAHLEQSSHFLQSLPGLKERVVDWDTAGACKAVQTGASSTDAAVASKDAAEAHGLQVLQANVSNLGGLSTRYIMVGKDTGKVPDGQQAKGSMAVLLRNEPMALMKLVSAFALRGLNITKLESQPACHAKNEMFSGRHFDDLFFVDFETKDEATTTAVTNNVKEFAQSVRFLGSYAKHVALEDRSHTEMPWTAYI